jgi:HEAT repeat protein
MLKTAFSKFSDESKLVVDALKSSNRQDRKEADKAIREQHKQLIDELVKMAAQQVKPTPSRSAQDSEYVRHQAKYTAINLLGDLRAVEAVPVLLANLEYINPDIVVVGSLVEEGQRYIAAEALSKVGMPAVKPIIDKLGEYDKDALGRRLCCWSLKRILGDRLSQLRLQIAIEETRSETAKANLKAALPYFRTPQEG